MNEEENYQEPGPRTGKMSHISDTLGGWGSPKKLDPVDSQCRECGSTFKADRFSVNVKVPKENYPGAFDTIRQEKIFGGLCPACNEKKAEEVRKAEEVARQAEFAKTRRKARLNCGIEVKYQTEDFKTFNLAGLPEGLKKAYRKTMDYADNFPLEARGQGYPSMVLFSESSWGVGKTHLASAIAHRILDRWQGDPYSCPVRFISEPDLLLQITATYNYSFEEKQIRESESDIIKGLIAVPLLIIDDVGKRKVADLRFVQRIHYSIIDGRYKRLKPIVLTANLDSEGLGRYLGGINPAGARDDAGDEATLDRLIEMCQGHFTKMDGQSYRRNKTAKGGK